MGAPLHFFRLNYPFLCSANLCMPLAPCTTESSEREYLVTMRNVQIDIWDLTSGKIIKTVENKIHDWSSHHEGCEIEKRHLVSAKHYVVYAGYRSHQFFIMNVDDPGNHTKVDLFEPYKYDKHCEAPDFGNVYREHISTLCIDTNTEYVLLCNGPTRSIHMCSLADGEQIKVIKGDTSLGKIHSFFFPSCTTDWMYFATKNMVSRTSVCVHYWALSSVIMSEYLVTHPLGYTTFTVLLNGSLP